MLLARVVGTPLNRLSNRDAANRTLLDVMKELGQLSESTSRPMEVRVYAESLVSMARASLASAGAIDALLRKKIEACLDSLREVLEPVAGELIATARCHGDLQPGNILWRSDGHSVIDWEYAARRQVGHDTLVYQLRTRFPRGLARRLESFVASGLVGLEKESLSQRRRTAHLLCLEELELNLRESKNPLFFSVGDSFLELVEEVEIWLLGRGGGR